MLEFDLIGKLIQGIRAKPIYGFIGAALIFGLTESLIIPILGNYPSLSALQPKDLWVRIASIITNFLVSPIGWAYYISTLDIPTTVTSELESNQVISPKNKKQIVIWQIDYENDLGNKYIAIVVWLLPAFVTAIVIKRE